MKKSAVLSLWMQGERDRGRIAEMAGTSRDYVGNLLSQAGLAKLPPGRPMEKNLDTMVAAFLAGERDLERLRLIGGYKSIAVVRTSLARRGVHLRRWR